MKPVFEITGPIDTKIVHKLPLKANLHSFVSPWCRNTMNHGRVVIESLDHDFYVTDRVIDSCNEEYTQLECVKCGIQGFINTRVENNGVWLENHFDLYTGKPEEPIKSCLEYKMDEALG